uniref:Uncharacterized protein n=1 Tax=uncultured prokaryote TaxID=198431 RepID=A0A0H5QJX7_9ZZZZ|nr:hypothetical protein [uncultured prokaryote]
MSKAGQGGSSLNERLALKLEEDRKQIEAMLLSEHRKLGQSLLDASQAEFSTIQNVIHAQSQRTVQSMRVMLRWPLWTATGCLAIVLTSLALLWAVTWWLREDLAGIRTATISERQALADLEAQTNKLRVTTSKEGTFLVLPEGIDASQIWTCGKQPCLRIGE